MQTELLYIDTFEGAGKIGSRLFRVIFTEDGQFLQEYDFIMKVWHRNYELSPEEVQAIRQLFIGLPLV